MEQEHQEFGMAIWKHSGLVVMAGAARRSTRAPHMHVLLRACSNHGRLRIAMWAFVKFDLSLEQCVGPGGGALGGDGTTLKSDSPFQSVSR